MSSAADARRGRSRSIAWSIFALVLASVLVATAIFFGITFRGPPPIEGPHGIERMVPALRGEPFHDEHVIVERHTTPPVADHWTRPDQDTRERLARLLDVPVRDMIAFVDRLPPRPGEPFMGHFAFAVRDGTGWRVARNAPMPLFTPWHWETLTAMLAAILTLALPAWALSRAISRPLRQLAEVAGQARVGTPLPPLPTRGSREVLALSDAVGAMHARLTGYAEGRTTMLAAIAHDMGTPLSRLAFRIEQLPDAARERGSADIAEMRAMIAAALSFARDELRDEMAARLDLGSLLDSLIEDMAEAGQPVTIDPGPRAIVRGDSTALRRLFTNLIDNAIRYGDDAAVGWSVADGHVTATVNDSGPGVDPASVERMFEPFVRGDPSRNRATGGTGLGLAIVRSIAERHGGTATLETGPRGGRARVTLPLA